MVACKHILWFTKGDYGGDYVTNVIKSKYQGKDNHKWAQSTIESDYYIKHMTEENKIVYDPCMGQGTFLISAAKLKRQCIGSDIDKEHFETAKKLITLGLRESIKEKKKNCVCTCHKNKNDSICCSCTCDYKKLEKKTKEKSTIA